MYPFYEVHILSSLIFYGFLSLALVLGLGLLGPWLCRRLKYPMDSHRLACGPCVVVKARVAEQS